MTAALSWLNDLANWIGSWFPRLTLIEPTHRGVLFGARGTATLLKPGLRIYWPIAQTLVRVPVTTQSVQPCSQMLPHHDTVSMIPRVTLCAVAIQFRVIDPVKFATKALSPHALIDNRVSAAIARHVGLSSDRAKWASAALSDVSEEIEPFGVLIERLDFTGFCDGVSLKNVADWNYRDNESGTRPAA